jgi:hypothetical protein
MGRPVTRKSIRHIQGERDAPWIATESSGFVLRGDDTGLVPLYLDHAPLGLRVSADLSALPGSCEGTLFIRNQRCVGAKFKDSSDDRSADAC